MSQPFKLFRLQQTDSQIDQAQARLQAVETALQEDRALRQARRAVEEAGAALEKERKTLRRAEEEVRAQRLKIEQTEATLYGGRVRSPKELQDLQNEAAALKRYLSVLEDRQLEAMLAVDAAEEAYAGAAAALEKTQSEASTKNSQLSAEREGLLRDLERLEDERRATASSLEEPDINLYEELRKQRRGVAVALVTDKACSACGSILSAAQLHAARSPNQITRCNTCGRILYSG